MICFGVANAIAAGLAGGVAEKLGRIKLAILCALINLALFAYMLIYEAKQGDYIKYCAFAAIWGICDGVWLVVINGELRKALIDILKGKLISFLLLLTVIKCFFLLSGIVTNFMTKLCL